MRTWTATICEWGGVGRRDWGVVKRRTPAAVGTKVHHVCSRSQAFNPLAGFTLLELSVVIFILGLLVTLALPRFGSIGRARLEASAKRLASLVRYLGSEAAFKSQLYRLHYDLDEHTYWVSVFAAGQNQQNQQNQIDQQARAEFIDDPDPLAQPVRLPPTISFADVRVPGIGRVSRGNVYTHFYPQGYTDPTVIHLRDQEARVMTVSIPPLIGEVGVFEGYVDGTLTATE